MVVFSILSFPEYLNLTTMDIQFQTQKKINATKARAIRRSILKHKRRFKLLRNNKSHLPQRTTSTPSVCSGLTKRTPLADITSAILNHQRTNMVHDSPICASSNNTSHIQVSHSRFNAQHFKVNLANKFDAVIEVLTPNNIVDSPISSSIKLMKICTPNILYGSCSTQKTRPVPKPVNNDEIRPPKVSSISIESPNKRKETSIELDFDQSSSSGEDFNSDSDISHSDIESEDDCANNLVSANSSKSKQGYKNL
jgi:hypothetical protein